MNIRTLFSSGIFRLASLSVCSLLLASCVNPKEVLYIQDITDETHQNIVTKYQTTIQKDDQLLYFRQQQATGIDRSFHHGGNGQFHFQQQQ